MDCVVIHQKFGVAQCKGVVVEVELLAVLESDSDGFVLITSIGMSANVRYHIDKTTNAITFNASGDMRSDVPLLYVVVRAVMTGQFI